MAFNPELANRLRDLFGADPQVYELKMFGGLAFMHRGHMCCGVLADELMVRVGADAYACCLSEAHTRPMDFTGRPMKGMVMVAASGLETAASLRRWVERAVAYTTTLPPKKPKARKPKPRKPVRAR